MIYEKTVEQAMSWTSRGSVGIQLTGTQWGLSFYEWEARMRENLRDKKNSVARCLRKRAWDLDLQEKQVAEALATHQK